MAKIFYRKYKTLVDNNEMTIDEVLERIPRRWRDEVKELFNKGEQK